MVTIFWLKLFRKRRFYHVCFLLFLSYTNLYIPNIYAQNEAIYLEKYTISKIYFEGGAELNRYYIFSFLGFKEGDTFTPNQLKQKLEDSRRILRSQWYFQADFETRYYAEGRVEIFVLLEPSPRRFGLLGATPDEHSFYFGFSGRRKPPGSAFRFQLGKVSGVSWHFPRIDNSFFGMNLIIAEIQTQKFLERLNLDELGLTTLWLRSGLEEFIQISPAVQFGLSQKYWLILNLNIFDLISEVAIGAFVDLDGLYLLKSRLWAMKFWFQFDVGILTGLLLLHSKYKFLLRPAPWLELGFYTSLLSNIIGSLNIGSLDAEIPSINLDDNDIDFYGLGRLRATFQLSQNDYDNRTEFNAGFALEGKLGLFAGLFNNTVEPQFGVEIQGGVVLDILTPGAFTTRFYFLTGINITNEQPVAEFLVENRF